MKIRQKRYGVDTNILKYKMYLRMLMVYVPSNTYAKFEAQFMKKLSQRLS